MTVRIKWVIYHPWNAPPEAWLIYKDHTLGIYPRKSHTPIRTFRRDYGGPYAVVKEKPPRAFLTRGAH